MSDAGLLDFAGLDAAAAAVETTPEVDSTVTVDTATDSGADTNVDSASREDSAEGTSDTKAEGVDSAVKTEAGKEKTATAAKDEALPGDEKTPQEIRRVLKAIKDADPKNAAAVKQLHGAFERYNAFKEIYPTVQEAQEAKQFIENIGGYDGFEQLQTTLKSVEESDQLLYAGDGKLIDDIYEQMKGENKQDSFGKLASPFLDKLKEVDKKAYYNTLTPHYVASLEASHLPQVLSALTAALGKGDEAGLAQAKELVADMDGWFKSLKGEAEKSKQGPTPEQLALKAEREKFQKEQADFKTNQTKEFQQAVGKEAETSNNKKLGAELTPYLKTAYFKAFKTENLKPLARQIQDDLRSELTADKGYQTQMKALWGAKNPDRAKILQFHNTKIETMAARIVRDAVNKMYPDHAKGGSAAGRVAAATQKKEAVAKADAAATSAGQPAYVAVKPKNINRSMDPKSLLEIAGKGYIPNGKGGWKLVTWRKP
jgi:hypothetical protein